VTVANGRARARCRRPMGVSADVWAVLEGDVCTDDVSMEESRSGKGERSGGRGVL
jgi:hypothetical protein